MASPKKSPNMQANEQFQPEIKTSLPTEFQHGSSTNDPIKQEAGFETAPNGESVALSDANKGEKASFSYATKGEEASFTSIKNEEGYCDSFPAGYRFVPHDEELVIYYLRNKVLNQPLPHNHIKDVNLYKHNPEELAEKHEGLGENQWYFFTPRDRKYRNGSRPNRAAGNGYWKATGADKVIKLNDVTVGYRKALVFYEGKPPKGFKTNWIMHEYRVSGGSRDKKDANDMRLDDWVLCRIYKKADKLNKGIQVQEYQHDHVQEESFSDDVKTFSIANDVKMIGDYTSVFNSTNGFVRWDDNYQQLPIHNGITEYPLNSGAKTIYPQVETPINSVDNIFRSDYLNEDVCLKSRTSQQENWSISNQIENEYYIDNLTLSDWDNALSTNIGQSDTPTSDVFDGFDVKQSQQVARISI